MSPRWGSTPRLTGRLTVGRKVTLTLWSGRAVEGYFQIRKPKTFIKNNMLVIQVGTKYFYSSLAGMPGVARDSIRNEGIREIMASLPSNGPRTDPKENVPMHSNSHIYRRCRCPQNGPK
jgi:hypothetical protein